MGNRGTQGYRGGARGQETYLTGSGCKPGSPQFALHRDERVARTGDTGEAYLEEFFGVPRQTFTILKGSPSTYKAKLPLAGGRARQTRGSGQARRGGTPKTYRWHWGGTRQGENAGRRMQRGRAWMERGT